MVIIEKDWEWLFILSLGKKWLNCGDVEVI